MNLVERGIVIMVNHNYVDIIQFIYNIVESEVPELVKVSVILYLFIIADNDYALSYWLKEQIHKVKR